MGVIKLGIAALALSLSLPVAKACACSCIYRTEAEHMESADAVFEGTAMERRDSGSAEEWIFEVARVIKGEVSDPQSIWADTYSTCSVRFEVGRSYRVYGDIQEDGMRTGICSGTRSLDSDEPLRPQESPGPLESPSPEPSPTLEIVEPIAPVSPPIPTTAPPIPATPSSTPISLPTIEAVTLGSSREPPYAPWLPAAGMGSIAILTAGVSVLKGWRRSKQR